MSRLNISLIFGTPPNFNKEAFKYFILSLNKLQNSYEFFFPDINEFPFSEKICIHETSTAIFEDFISNKKINAHYHIGIITSNFDSNFFFNSDENTAIITTDIWEKHFSPPSLFEYLLHCIICCLIYSQKLPDSRNITDEMNLINIGSHV